MPTPPHTPQNVGSHPFTPWFIRPGFAPNTHRFIPGLRRANIVMDRKVLADLAVTEPYSFKAVVETVRSAAQQSR